MTARPAEDEGRPSQAQNLVEADLFRTLLYLETQKALRLRYSISVLCVSVGGKSEDQQSSLTGYVADTMIRRLRATDVATVLSASEIGVLLVDAELQSVRQVFDRVTQTLLGHPGQGEDRGSPLTLRAGAVCFPRTVTNVSDLVPQARALMRRATEDEAASLYLPD
jgi:hypothetical protein